MPVGGVMLNASVQLETAAFGVTCATFGATGVVFVRSWLEKYATPPRIAVNSNIKMIFSLLFPVFIVLFPCIIDKHLCSNRKVYFIRRNGIVGGNKFPTGVFRGGFFPCCGTIDLEMRFGRIV